jgi:multiple sugar transport system substrate-binding protein
MKNRILYVILSLVAASALLVACAPAATPTEEAPLPAEPTEEPAPPPEEDTEEPMEEKEEVVLHFLKYQNDQEALAMAEMVEEFHTIEDGKWAHVTIEFDAKPFAELFPAIEKAVATGSDVDIVQADGPDVKHFAYNGVLADLTDHFSEEEMKTWAPQSIEEGSMLERFYAPPMVQSCQLMWFNQDMIDAAGIDVSSPDAWTYGPDGTGLPNWQKLTTDADGDGTPEVFGLVTYFTNAYWVHGPARSNGEVGSPTYQGVGPDGITFVGYFDTPEAIEAYQFMQDMIYEYGVMSAESVTDAFFSDLSATYVYTDTIIGNRNLKFPDFNMGAIEPPYFVTPICQTGSWHYGITTTTDHFEEALAWVKYATSDAGAAHIWKYKNQLPANINLYNTIDEFSDPDNPRRLMANFFQEYGVSRITTPGYTEFNTLFSEFFQALLAGEEDVAGLTQEYAQLMEAATAKYEGWDK